MDGGITNIWEDYKVSIFKEEGWISLAEYILVFAITNNGCRRTSVTADSNAAWTSDSKVTVANSFAT